MKIIVKTISVVTNSSGAVSSDPFPVSGFLMRISYKPDGANPLATGADLTLTETNTGLTIYTQADIGVTAFTKLPRKPISSTVDGVDSTTIYDYVPVTDRMTLTIAQGGNTKSGTFYVVYSE